jgi:hypothetical protein
MGVFALIIVIPILFKIISEYKTSNQKINDADNNPNCYYKSNKYPNGYYSVEERYGKRK